jgi:phosphoserine phosphatase RsbU/P
MSSTSRSSQLSDIPAVSQTVLVVDDEPIARVSLAARLKRLGYRVLEAADGKTGFDLLRRERPDLTILDWMMPELDGPSFCEQVRLDPEIQSSQILMMTSHDQPEQIAEGLARGADDYLSKSASRQEVTARVKAGLRAANLIRTLEQARDDIRGKQEILEQELQSAARYVESLLPVAGRLLPGVQMVHAYRPALSLGGDLFNIVPWNDQVFGLYLLDASGHGVSPALRSASFSTFLRQESLLHQVGSNDPGVILTEANKQFPLTADGNYFTIIFVRVDLRERILSYAAAGHNGALLHRQSGEVLWLTSPNLPLGFVTENCYESVDLPILSGDRLYVLSDGLYEVPNSEGELWGRGRLEETIRALGRCPLAEVVSHTIDAATRWLGHDQFPDDVALMGIELT